MAKNQNNNVAPATKKTGAEAKKDALATALAQIEKQFGKGAVMKLGDNTAMQVDAISTGSLGLDMALGVGGVPRGRIIEVYGPESSGKTTLALHILAEAQKKGGDVAFIDVEHALDPVYAEALGVDINNLLVSQPDAPHRVQGKTGTDSIIHPAHFFRGEVSEEFQHPAFVYGKNLLCLNDGWYGEKLVHQQAVGRLGILFCRLACQCGHDQRG